MTQILNQFTQTPEKGQIAFGITPNTISGIIKSDSTDTFIGGTAVKLSDVAGNQLVFEKAGDTDEVYGFVLFNIKDNARVAGDVVEVVFASSIMNMEAGAAIAQGAKVEIDSANDKVITSAGTNTIVGIALKKATADEDIIPVHVLTPLINQV